MLTKKEIENIIHCLLPGLIRTWELMGHRECVKDISEFRFKSPRNNLHVIKRSPSPFLISILKKSKGC